MEQKIFELGLSVETVSIYLMCTGLVDSGTDLTFDNMVSVWNGTEKALRDGLAELEKKRIVTRVDKEGSYQITGSENWDV